MKAYLFFVAIVFILVATQLVSNVVTANGYVAPNNVASPPPQQHNKNSNAAEQQQQQPQGKNLLAVATAVVNLAQRVFGTTNNRAVVTLAAAQKGLSALDMTRIEEVAEVRPERMPLYIATLLSQLTPNIAAEDLQTVRAILQRILLIEPDRFFAEAVHITYKDGHGRFVLFRIDLAHVPGHNNLFVGFSFTRTAFTMAPNVTVIRHQKKSWLRDNTWDEIMYTPHHLTEDDVQMISQRLSFAIATPSEKWLARIAPLGGVGALSG